MYSRKTQSAGLWFLVVASLLAVSPQAASAADKGVFGYWKRVDAETGKVQSIFRLWEDKGKLVGQIVKVYPTAGKPVQEVCTDCTGRQQNKPVAGLLFLWNFVPDKGSEKKWVEGTVLNPENGKTYKCEIELSEDGKQLNVYGYVQFLVKLGGTSKWERPTADELKGL